MSASIKAPSAASPRYRGRFAPSPTGPLHFGSLVAAVGSYLDARAHGGEWLVRIEDVDEPRTVPGAAGRILRSLEAHGFEWTGPVIHQSARKDAYQAALQALRREGAAYPCACSRREAGDGPYPGTCRAGLPPGREGRAWRMRVGDAEIRFTDRLQGECAERLAETCGDFVIRRADGLFAYQLAVVVDDASQGVTHVVRGADLLDSTARQIWLHRALGSRAPSYLHLPVAASASGEKLSKQTLAPPLDDSRAAESLARALRFLGQDAPAGPWSAEPAELWRWAAAHWDPARLPAAALIRDPYN